MNLKHRLSAGAALLCAFVSFCCASVSAQSEQEKLEGYRPFFAVNDLSDWEGDARIWSIEDGVIIGQTDDDARKLAANTFLIYKKEVPNDFILRFEYRITKDGNSGVQYRSFRMPEVDEDDDGNEIRIPYRVGGYQADFDGGANFSGMIYGENFRWMLSERGRVCRIQPGRNITTLLLFEEDEKLKEKVKIEDWNTYEITAVGYTFIHRINGQVMSMLIDDDPDNRRDSGILAIQAHAGPPMKVEIKNMRIKEVK